MANIASSEKSARQDVVRNARKTATLAGIKTAQKRFAKAIDAKDSDAVKVGFNSYVSTLDKAAKRGAIHQNSADRRKGRAAKLLASA